MNDLNLPVYTNYKINFDHEITNCGINNCHYTRYEQIYSKNKQYLYTITKECDKTKLLQIFPIFSEKLMKLFYGKIPTCLQIIRRAFTVWLDHTPKLFFLLTLLAREQAISHFRVKPHLFFLLDTLLETGTIDSKLSYPSSNTLL